MGIKGQLLERATSLLHDLKETKHLNDREKLELLMDMGPHFQKAYLDLGGASRREKDPEPVVDDAIEPVEPTVSPELSEPPAPEPVPAELPPTEQPPADDSGSLEESAAAESPDAEPSESSPALDDPEEPAHAAETPSAKKTKRGR